MNESLVYNLQVLKPQTIHAPMTSDTVYAVVTDYCLDDTLTSNGQKAKVYMQRSLVGGPYFDALRNAIQSDQASVYAVFHGHQDEIISRAEDLVLILNQGTHVAPYTKEAALAELQIGLIDRLKQYFR